MILWLFIKICKTNGTSKSRSKSKRPQWKMFSCLWEMRHNHQILNSKCINNRQNQQPVTTPRDKDSRPELWSSPLYPKWKASSLKTKLWALRVYRIILNQNKAWCKRKSLYRRKCSRVSPKGSKTIWARCRKQFSLRKDQNLIVTTSRKKKTFNKTILSKNYQMKMI